MRTFPSDICSLIVLFDVCSKIIPHLILLRKLPHISSYCEEMIYQCIGCKIFLAEEISTNDRKSYLLVSLYFVFLIFIPRKRCFKLALHFLVVKSCFQICSWIL